MPKFTFADEDARVTAIQELGDDPSNLEKLNEIRNAEIGEPSETSTETVVEPEPVIENKSEEKKPVQDKAFTILDKDLPQGYDTPGKAFKSLVEAQELIKRQTEFIKTNLQSSQKTTAEAEALARAEKAERELVALREGAQGETKKATDANISSVQADISRIDALQKELDEQIENDPDSAFTAEYNKKQRELSKLQTKNLNVLSDLYAQAREEISQTKNITTEFVSRDQKEKETGEALKARKSLYDEMSDLDIPEFKLSKRAEDVEKEYLSWRRDVAIARLGRPPANTTEEFEALEQLQLKNPELISKLALIQTPSEPSEDVKRYMLNCEALDYKQGWRKDLVSGKFKRLTQYDPETNQSVPLILPSLKIAIQQMRLENGFYDKQIDGAFQKGAEKVAEAASRRDKGAIELHGGSDQGQSPGGVEWAVNLLETINEEDAMMEYRRGNKAKVDEINKARAVLKLDALNFPE